MPTCKNPKGNPRIGEVNRKAPGESSVTTRLGEYQRNCKKTGRAFELSREEFHKLIIQPCYYCGTVPIPRVLKKGIPDLFAANGIDRVNNEIGYVLSNCVTCCVTCNRAKHNKSSGEFKSWLRQVAKYNADL